MRVKGHRPELAKSRVLYSALTALWAHAYGDVLGVHMFAAAQAGYLMLVNSLLSPQQLATPA
jgi:hypothetical protein